jgi:hypothetical protein
MKKNSIILSSLTFLFLFGVVILEIHALEPGGAGFTPETDVYVSTDRSALEEHSESEIDKRLLVLESSRADVGVWIKLFIATVTILITINIGLSVWQVGSIARREVENRIQEYDIKFGGFLSSREKYFDEKIASYETRLNMLLEKINKLETKSESNIDIANGKIGEFKSQIQSVLNNFREEAQEIRVAVLSDLEKWRTRRMQR